jgi:hypothetical protein
MFVTLINISGATPTIGAGVSIIGQQFGLIFDVWVLRVKLKQDAGGVQDVFLQTRDQEGGEWSDIAHFPQLAAGAAFLTYRVGFYRGLQPAATATVVNTVDNTPTLPANTILTWANGLDLRCTVVPGAGATGTGAVTITGMSVPG